ncbi:kinesin heavy chain, partial [Hyaloraphidium curvatum]
LNAKQEDVFAFSALPIVEDVMKGYNGTIFAYGQTGSGKTHTMMGPDIDDSTLKGIIPRLVEAIFSQIESSPETLEFAIKVSFMEIYMERIRDLLNPVNDNLPIHEEKGRGVFVKGMMEIYVSQIEEVFDIMKRGLVNRAVAYTNMNEASSRSHSIFVITVQCKNTKDGSNRIGRLYLVDLAGSEKIKKTDAAGQTLEEAKKINKSLSALGNVINALTDGKSTHVPYRDSKLTRILQESLGGNSKTTLVVCCSPSSYNDMETLSALRFGMRAKTIKNKARVNQELSPAELKAALKKTKADLETFKSYASLLEGEVVVWRAGGTVPPEKFALLGNRPDAPALSDALASVNAAALPEITGRSATPTVPDEEREDFLRRENELSDQLAEKERDLNSMTRMVEQLKNELGSVIARETRLLKESKENTAALAEVKIRLEKAEFNAREAVITADSLKERVGELAEENEDLKKQLVAVQAQQSSINDLEREKKRLATIGKIMAELSPDVSIDEREAQIRGALAKLGGEPTDIDALSVPFEEMRKKLAAAESRNAALMEEMAQLQRSGAEQEELRAQLMEAEVSLARLSEEYSALLEKKIAQESETNETATAKLTKLLGAEKTTNEELKATIEELRASIPKDVTPSELLKKEADLEKIRKQMVCGHKSCVERLPLRHGVSQAQQLAEFDSMKKKLMQNLQQRVDKVIEMEISLDETREQYNSVIRSASTKEQQRKMTFLERNLEQLMSVQKELVDQNTNLKKEVTVAERKLAARNERIQTLESLLIDAQEKFRSQQTKFEAELGALRKQLQDAVEALERERSGQHGDWLHGSSRIAKPVRGGRAVEEDSAPAPDPLTASNSWIGGGSAGGIAGTLGKTASTSSVSAASTLAGSDRRSWFWTK